jgi:hypothetical protein
MSKWARAKCQIGVKGCEGGVCTGKAPAEVASVCADGRWLIYGDYSGPLTVNGSVSISGDYILSQEQLLVFWGVNSHLEIFGKLSINEAIYMHLDPDSYDTLMKSRYSYEYYDSEYDSYYNATSKGLKIWGFITSLESDNQPGTTPRIFAKTSRSCKNAFASLAGSGNFTLSLNPRNNCNLWWILLLAVGLPIVVTLALTLGLLFGCT